jgi:hypothetical protein
MQLNRTLGLFVVCLIALGFSGGCHHGSGTIKIGEATPEISPPPPTTEPALTIDASAPLDPPMSGHLKMGGSNPAGIEINANSQYLTLAGKPWFPVMGEFHYVRYPRDEWEDEILKMKAGGITVVSTYVFWIYHEEIEGQFDWTGDRDLRQFIQLCAKHGMYVYLRIGPWAHGEVRNGGLPDWVQAKCGLKALRTIDPIFMGCVRPYYTEIRRQIDGLLFKDGGPIIGIQLDNETWRTDYLAALKTLALDVGFNVPLYSNTGWNRAHGPADEMLPMYGGYPDGFWLTEKGMSKSGRRQYVFTHILDDANITEHLTARPGTMVLSAQSRYPYLTCEIGGGMAISYARRPLMSVDDVAALPLVKMGSGANSLGYYMYHGGGDLIGKLSTLQETQATNYPNDLPVINYDFQAPLGQFGQVRDSFNALRLLHMFVADFGSYLAPMRSDFPTTMPDSLSDTQTLRAAVRSDGHRGFVFINNYQRGTQMPEHRQVRLSVKLADGDQLIPSTPVTIPSGSYMILPFNLDMNGVLLKSASAQLLCRLDGPVPTYVFFTIPGVDSYFTFDQTIMPRTDSMFTVHANDGREARVLMLTRQEALHCWKANIGGADRLLMSPANLIFEGQSVRMQATDPKNMYVSVFPSLSGERKTSTESFSPGSYFFTASIAEKTVDVKVEPVQSAGPARPIVMGKKKKPEPPTDADFETAAVWHIGIPKDSLDGVNDVLLRINYVGDAARAYVGNKLVDDDYYYGRPWEIGLKRFAPEVLAKGITLKILPLSSGAPIYIQEDHRPAFDADGSALELRSVKPEIVYETEMRFSQ